MGIAFMQKVTEQNSTLGCTATAKSFYFYFGIRYQLSKILYNNKFVLPHRSQRINYL